jgi:hypothetical protein
MVGSWRAIGSVMTGECKSTLTSIVRALSVKCFCSVRAGGGWAVLLPLVAATTEISMAPLASAAITRRRIRDGMLVDNRASMTGGSGLGGSQLAELLLRKASA